MLAGELYDAGDPELVELRLRCEVLLRELNAEADEATRDALLARLLGAVGPGAVVRPPFTCDYGVNIRLGAGVFVNYDALVLDCAEVVVGDHAQLGPRVQLITADHPRHPVARRGGRECAFPVTIGPNAWIGAGVIVCPGVTVGEDAIVGAGSVVTRDVPPGVVAAGVPCRVLRGI